MPNPKLNEPQATEILHHAVAVENVDRAAVSISGHLSGGAHGVTEAFVTAKRSDVRQRI
jgi:hypothetical protein